MQELLAQWLQDSVDAKYRTCETDAATLKWLSTSNADPERLVDVIYKQVEFWGEGTWGESFLVAPSDVLATELKLPKDAVNQYAVASLLQVLHLYKNEYLSPLDPPPTHPLLDPPRPPFNAEYLLYVFLQRGDREIVIGDLAESYGRVLQRFGKRRADFWFYKQVIWSLGPLFRRQMVRIGALVWLGRILRRLIS